MIQAKTTSTRFGVRGQLVFAFSLLVAIIVIIIGIAYWGLNSIQEADRRSTEANDQMGRITSEIGIQTLMVRRYEKDFFLNINDPPTRNDYLTKWRQANTDLGKTIAAFAAHTITVEDKQQATEWQQELSAYQQGFDNVATAVEDGHISTPQAANQSTTPFKDSISQLTDSTLATAASKMDIASATDVTLENLVMNTIWLLIAAGVIAIVIAIVWSFAFPNRLVKPILVLQEATKRLAGGDLTSRVGLDRQDEIGMLGHSFNQMADTIHNQIIEQKRTYDELQAANIEQKRIYDELQVANIEQQRTSDELRAANIEQQRTYEELRVANSAMVAKEYIEKIVRDYSAFANEVAKGNLTARLQVADNQDDLTVLGRNLNTMVVSLHTITNQVQQANANITVAAAEILAATTQQAASAAEQSAALNQTTTTMEEIKAIAEQTAQQASELAQESQAALGVARQGTQAVEETVGSMSRIRARVESIAQTILALAEQTQEIGAIITTVNELADQSNLLALNAAIEAARAGESGKSFAIVAQHVRNLADRSKAATKQVREILGEIQKSTNAAVLVTEEGTKGVEMGERLAGQAGQVIHRIAADVETGVQANVQIAAAAKQQTSGMAQIGQAMISISQATNQALASTRQAEQAARNLNTLAQSLQQDIAIYRL